MDRPPSFAESVVDSIEPPSFVESVGDLLSSSNEDVDSLGGSVVHVVGHMWKTPLGPMLAGDPEHPLGNFFNAKRTERFSGRRHNREYDLVQEFGHNPPPEHFAYYDCGSDVKTNIYNLDEVTIGQRLLKIYEIIPSSVRKAFYTLLLVALLTYIYRKTEDIIAEQDAAYCSTHLCKQSAHLMYQSVDSEVKPCRDFWSYACGKWQHAFPPERGQLYTSRHDEQLERIFKHMGDILSSSDEAEDSTAFQEASRLYRSCLDTDKLQKEGVEPVRRVLQSLGLPVIPAVDFNLARTLALAKRKLDLDIFFKVDVEQIERPAHDNKAYYSAVLMPHRFIVPGVGKSQIKKAKREELIHHIARLITLMEPEDYPWSTARLEQLAKKMASILISFAKTSAEIISDISEQSRLTTTFSTLKHLSQSKLMDWNEYEDFLFEGLNRSRSLVVYKPEYLSPLFEMLQMVEQKYLQLVVWLQVLEALIPMTNALNQMGIFEFQKRLNLEDRHIMACVTQVSRLFPGALVHKIGQKFNAVKIQADIEHMLERMNEAFDFFVHNGSLFTEERVRDYAKNKLKNIRMYIGCQQDLEVVNRSEELQQFPYMYQWISHMTCRVNTRLATMDTQYTRLQHDKWISCRGITPTSLTVRYEVTANALVVSMAALIPQIYYGFGIRALDYGLLGSRLFSEAFKAVGTVGRSYDKEGNRVLPWYDTAAMNAIEDKTRCFKKFIERNKLCLNKENWKERINVLMNEQAGISLAYAAYALDTAAHDRRVKRLHLTGKQMVLLAYAHGFCTSDFPDTTDVDTEDIDNDLRTYFKGMLMGGLMNLPRFAEVYNCPWREGMVSKPRCLVLADDSKEWQW